MSLLGRLAPVLIEDPDQARRSEIVTRVCFSFAGAAGAWTLGALFLMPRFVALIGLATTAVLVSFGLLGRRRPDAAATAFVAFIWALSCHAVWWTGGSMAAATGTFVLAIAAAGILLGVRAAVLVGVGSTIASAGLVALGELGRLRSGAEVPSNWVLWAVSVAVMAGMPVLLWVALRRTREALRRAEESERRYRLLADNARDLIWLTEGDQLRYVSPASQAIFGWSPEEVLARGAGLQSFTPDSAQLVSGELERAAASGQSHVRYEGEVLRRDGRSVWCEVEVTFLRGADGKVTGMLGVTRDITQRRAIEQERERLQQELMQSQKTELLGRISAGVAHDLNNQLTVILGSLDDLQAGLEEGDARLGFVAEARDASHSAAALTRQLLIFSARHVTQRAALDLAELLRRLERTLRRLVGAEVELALELGDAPAIVLADAAQLEQVVINLVVNARDAMPRGGRLTLALSSRRESAGERVCLHVTDTGTGIDAATQAQMFEPFFTTKPPGRGTGLGLSIVRRIVEEAGGSVRVESELGRGTRVEVSLPRHASVPEAEPRREPAHAAASVGASILVVDDVPEVRRMLARALANHGYRVLEAPSGSHALALARAHGRLDLLVTDVVMPGMRGPELAKQLRQEQPALPVLFVSGYAEEDLDVGANGRTAVLVKPFPTHNLLERVRQLLEGAEPPGHS